MSAFCKQEQEVQWIWKKELVLLVPVYSIFCEWMFQVRDGHKGCKYFTIPKID